MCDVVALTQYCKLISFFTFYLRHQSKTWAIRSFLFRPDVSEIITPVSIQHLQIGVIS